MKILQVTPYFAPAWAYGGPPRVMSDFASRPRRARARRSTCSRPTSSTSTSERPRRYEVLDGVRVRRLPNLSNSLAWRTKKYLPRGFVRRARRRGRALRRRARHRRANLLTAVGASRDRARETDAAGPLCTRVAAGLERAARARSRTSTTWRSSGRCFAARRCSSPRPRTRRRLYEQFGGRARGDQSAAAAAAAARHGAGRRGGRSGESIGARPRQRLLLFLGRINRLQGAGRPDRGRRAAARGGRRCSPSSVATTASSTSSGAASRRSSRTGACASPARSTATSGSRPTRTRTCSA